MLQFSSIAQINSLFWITSLKQEEQGTTDRVIEDLEPFFKTLGLPFQVFEPKNAADLAAILRSIAIAANDGAKPMIHFDTHGDKDHGLQIAANKEFVPWHSLYALLRTINIATRNNLCVFSAACHSLNVIRQISILEPCPFYILLAPEHEISFGLIEANTVAFYKDVFQKHNLVAAYEANFKPHLKAFHAEQMFAVALARYFKFNCLGAGGAKRREDLMTQAFALGLPNTPQNRRMIRRTAKEKTRPNAVMVRRYAERFLIGKRLPFGYVDIMKLIGANAE